jgi:hypothetical protein
VDKPGRAEAVKAGWRVRVKVEGEQVWEARVKAVRDRRAREWGVRVKRAQGWEPREWGVRVKPAREQVE